MFSIAWFAKLALRSRSVPIIVAKVDFERLSSILGGSDEKIDQFAEVLTEVVAAGLHVERLPDDTEDPGTLAAGDIEVTFREIGRHDLVAADVALDIEAMSYPRRRANGRERGIFIEKALAELFPELHVSAWIKFVDAVWISDEPSGANDSSEPVDMTREKVMGRCRAILGAELS